MTIWDFIATALTIIVFLVLCWTFRTRIGNLIRGIITNILIFIGIPIALCIAVVSLPFLIILFARNLFIKLISSSFYKNPIEYYADGSNKITHKKLNVYGSHTGSMDVFSRSGTTEDKAILTDGDWVLIESYIHDIWLARKGQLSESLYNKLETSIFNDCASISVVVKLKRMKWEYYHDSHKKGIFDKLLNWLFP
ncbi:MAG: hypothetical protein EOO55_04475 [Hymenobacter sp.]|nr:MAG: hypothetical protein EOO55_04475 [Hymenobacter sp.]